MPVSDGSSRDEVPTSDPHCFLAMYLDVRNRQPPSEKAHQIIARTALFVSEHGGQSEIVLRVKQGNNPTFGFLMPDHNLHSYFRYLVDHPQLLKDGADSFDTNKGNKIVEGEHASSGGALSLLGTAYDSGDEDEGTLLPTSKGTDPGNSMTPDALGHVKPASTIPDNKELGKNQNAFSEAAASVKSKPILAKKNPALTGNIIVAAQQEEVKDAITASTTAKSQITNSGLSETKEMILEPPSFMKRTMEKIVEFILTNGKEFEAKLIEQDKTTGRFPFLLSSNPYHSYYLRFLQESQESKSHGRSPDRNDRRGSSDRRDRRSSSERDDRRSSRQHNDRSSRELNDRRSSRERDNRRSSRDRDDRSSRDRDDRSSRDRDDRRSSMEHKGSSYGKEETRSNARPTTGMVSSASDGSSAGPSEKQLYDQQGKKGIFHPVRGVKKEPPRRVTADEAAAIVMEATRGLGAANDSLNTIKGKKEDIHIRGSNDHSSSFGSFSSLQDRDALSKHISNSEADTSLTSSGQVKKEGFGIIDDDWIANTIAKAAAVAASKEADSSEASMTKEQKLKAERLRRAKMFAAIVKGGGNKMNDLAAVSDQTDEPSEATPADINASGLDAPPEAKEREGSSAPFEFDVSNVTKEKDTDDEQNRVRKYRKKHHKESDEEKDESEESYKHSRKRHRSEHSRGHSKDAHKHKHKRHSKDRESGHRRHRHSSSEDEHEHRSSKSRNRHRDDDRYSDDEEHNRSRRHQREHRSGSKRKHEEEQDQSEQTQGRLEVSPSTSGAKLESDKRPGDTAQSSQGVTEVPSELRAKIRAMLLETL
ncbi:hypothetical protein SETIT_5G284100v2 [Setaria italica]|uniref:SURP motif domain-containing protein n=2 Tax=Setaria italica TaxID=4555 RepID=A0A368R9N4_SETIT|nr:transcription initiation factor TFIID subunit 1 isoform X2 [Setaria italica]XP_004969654.1 transcription initiation factor TFIID subunit 1 isoform X2 [Setaria italica]XP_022682569.1 transcription initiation factor TFIID subunit 1 isoform X2 [Setaria italica]RCV26917.1 hypothetical protein SETIT_5G284100v2 [Setaria italica]RCV26918.1 hypothetical protein SETIT_5G284100v2 [Setaria italica]